MKPFVLVLALATLGTTVLGKTDYCDPDLCNEGTHVACDGLETLSENCGDDAVEIPLSKSQQAMIVDQHNKLRSKLALGMQNYSSNAFFSPASRMATMRWDSELAAIAAVNARRCDFEHDKCRNTPKYRLSGQNLARKSFGSKPATENVIPDLINVWVKEYKFATPKVMALFPRNYAGEVIQHYTQIVVDRCTAVGCAMVRYVDKGLTKYYMVCNYAIGTVRDRPVYVAGKACSKCSTGCNPQYPGLCNPEEKIIPN